MDVLKPFLLVISAGLLYKASMARKTMTTSIDNDLQKEAKKLAIDLERPLNDLLEEAIKDLLKKYERKIKK